LRILEDAGVVLVQSNPTWRLPTYTLFRKTIATVENVFIAMYAPLMSFVLRRDSCTGGGTGVCDITEALRGFAHAGASMFLFSVV